MLNKRRRIDKHLGSHTSHNIQNRKIIFEGEKDDEISPWDVVGRSANTREVMPRGCKADFLLFLHHS